VLEAAPPEAIPEALTADLLASVGAMSIAVKYPQTRRLLAISDNPAQVAARFDLRTASPWSSIAGAFLTLFGPDDRNLLVIGDAPRGAEFIEIAIEGKPLRAAMWTYSVNVLLLSLLISGIVAALAVFALHVLVVSPVRRLTSSLIGFSQAPEDASRIIEPSGSRHEIGRAEEALAQMQRSLLRELQQKKHLAALGLAVAKVSHDLRNMLSTAQLLSDRLEESSDALVRSIGPKLIGTLGRAIGFCQSTLAYGRAVEPAPQPQAFALCAVVEEAIDVVAPSAGAHIALANECPPHVELVADREQIFRVLMNLLRNSVDALAAAGPQPGRSPVVAVRTRQEGGRAIIEVSDTGPGVPQHARANLFEPFRSSTRPGGAGLGLAIAAELVEAHGGSIRLLEQGVEGGATFCIELPASVLGPRRAAAPGEPPR
jgi:signal transduction histidine kinase